MLLGRFREMSLRRSIQHLNLGVYHPVIVTTHKNIELRWRATHLSVAAKHEMVRSIHRFPYDHRLLSRS